MNKHLEDSAIDPQLELSLQREMFHFSRGVLSVAKAGGQPETEVWSV